MNSERCLTGGSQILENFQKHRRKLVFCYTHKLFSKMLYSFHCFILYVIDREHRMVFIDGKVKKFFHKFTIAFFMNVPVFDTCIICFP